MTRFTSRAAALTILIGLAPTGAVRINTSAQPRSVTPAASDTGWRDPSPHQLSFIRVAPDVRLEVLDWGGQGLPLVFISGLGDTGHEFDDFAPRFTGRHRVVGFTRRGYGASSQPPAGYDVDTRVADLHAVLDSLGLQRVVLVGHSIAGDELTGFARKWPSRVAGLIYLDAAYDHSLIPAMLRRTPPPPEPAPTPADSTSPHGWLAWVRASYGVPITEADVRASSRFAPDGHYAGPVTPDSMFDVVTRQAGHPDYRGIGAPVLAIYQRADSAPVMFPYWDKLTSSERLRADQFAATFLSWAAAQRAQLARELPAARIVILPNANHYVFMSNPQTVERAMRAFLARLR